MIYVNGDGFAAASYANCAYSWAGQDPTYYVNGSQMHPKNVSVSFANLLSNALHQPLRLEAWQLKDNSSILEEAQVSLGLRLNYVIITWPNFFRGKIVHEDKIYRFEFNKINTYDVSQEVKDLMRAYTATFNYDALMAEFLRNLRILCEDMEQRKIRYSMAMSDQVLPSPVDFGRWIFDPAVQTITSWAATKELLNGAGFLSNVGHKELSKLLIVHLTSQ